MNEIIVAGIGPGHPDYMLPAPSARRRSSWAAGARSRSSRGRRAKDS